MPVIPTFENTLAVPLAPGPPRVGEDQFAAPGQALTQAGAAVSQEGQQWLAQYAEAKRQATASSLVASGMQALGDKRFTWSKLDDSEAAYTGYQQDAAGIIKQTIAQSNDPLVQSYVQRELTTQSIIDAQNTRNAAFGLESSKQRGVLDTTLANYAQQAATAPDPLTKAHYTDLASQAIEGARAGKWLAPQEADDRRLSFTSQIQEVQARHDMAADPITAAHVLQDPALLAAKYPGLLPEKGASMAAEAVWKAMRIEGRNAAAQAHQDAMAERNFRQQQQQNETDALTTIYSGQPVDSGQIMDMARAGRISPGGLNTIHTAMTQANEGQDDIHTKLDLLSMLQDRHLTADGVHAAVDARMISGKTATTLMQAIGEQQKTQGNAVDRGNFSTLQTAIGEAADGQSLLSFTKDADRAANAALRAQAKQEWTQRVTIQHQDSSAVLTDMLARYQRAPAAIKAMPKPMFGEVNSVGDLQAVALRTLQAREAGQIDQTVYEREVSLLNQLRPLVGGQVAAPGKTAAGGG